MKSDKTNFLCRKEKLERNIYNFFYSFNLLVEQVNLFNLTEFAIKNSQLFIDFIESCFCTNHKKTLTWFPLKATISNSADMSREKNVTDNYNCNYRGTFTSKNQSLEKLKPPA